MGADGPLLKVVAAAATSDDGRLLVVAKHAAPTVHYLPGGKPDPGESELEALHREVREELGVAVAEERRFTDVYAEATLERVPMHLVVYTARLVGDPRPAAEIASFQRWPAPDGSVALAPPIEHIVVPRLRAAGLLAPAA